MRSIDLQGLTQGLSNGIGGLSFDPQTTAVIGQLLHEQVTKLVDEQGLRAFEMSRTAACAHEVGHAMVGAVHGLQARSVEITRHAVPAEIRRAVGRSAWSGLTRWVQPHPFGPAGPVEFTAVATPIVLAQI